VKIVACIEAAAVIDKILTHLQHSICSMNPLERPASRRFPIAALACSVRRRPQRARLCAGILRVPDEGQVKSRLDRLQQLVMRVEAVIDHALDRVVRHRNEHDLVVEILRIVAIGTRARIGFPRNDMSN
jgi:hypothetical protein